MAEHVDFTRLTLQDAIDLAILIEDEAADRYSDLAAQMEAHHNMEVAKLFRRMVTNEQGHGEKLRKRRQALFGDAPVRVDPSMVPEVEAPDYASVRAFMSVHEALRLAHRAEVLAHAYFHDGLRWASDPKVRELFTELHWEEVEHRKIIESELAKLPPEDATNPEDFADEPNAQ